MRRFAPNGRATGEWPEGLAAVDQVLAEGFEAALSFSGQLALLGAMHDLASEGAQLVCATHSPILASLPGARLLEVGDSGIRETTYDDLELVGHWKRYLDDPRRYLRHVID